MVLPRSTPWCDRLCINQANDAERAQQVSLMRSIFSKAIFVVVWLGEEADGSDQFMKTLKRWVRYRDQHSNLGDLACWEAMWREDALRSASASFIPEDQMQTIVAKSYSLLLGQVNALLQRPYSRRVWVVQEVAVGSHVTVHCGESWAEWDDLVKCLQSLQLQKAYYDSTDLTSRSYRCFEMIHELRSKVRIARPIPLLRAIQENYGSKATDPRDKIFALLGLSYDADDYMPAISYDHSLRDTILNMTINAIKATGKLDFICMQGLTEARYSSQSWRLPTWAPNWLSNGDHPFNDRMVRYLTKELENGFFDGVSVAWDASSATCHDIPRIWDKNSLLCVDGVLVGIIDGLTPAAGLSAWSNLYQGEYQEDAAHGKAETLEAIYETLNMAERDESLYDATLKDDFFWCLNKTRSPIQP
jgi:Heterokaryon incompatibility protein (HET)